MMQQINLYHPIFRRQKKKFSALAMVQAGVAILAGVALIHGMMWWQMRGTAEEVNNTDKQLISANKRLEETNQKLGTGVPTQTLDDQITKLEVQVAERLRIRDVLNRGLFSNTTGYSDFLTAFARQHVSGVWLTGFGITGSGEDMRLQGRTTDPAQVPRYMQKLAAEKVMVGKEFQVFVMSRPEKKENQVMETSYVEFLFKTAPPKQAGKS